MACESFAIYYFKMTIGYSLEGSILKFYKKNSHHTLFFSTIAIFLSMFWSHTGITQDTLHLSPQPIKNSVPTTNLNVGVIMLYPFTSYNNEELSGLSYELWRLIAIKYHFKCTYFNLNNDVNKAVQLLHNHKLDVVIGPIGVLSETVPLVDYTLPYFHGQFVLLAKKKKLSFRHQLDAVFSEVSAVKIIFIVLFFVVYLHLFWIIEQKREPDLKGLTYRKGIGYLFWKCVLNNFEPPFFPHSLVVRIFAGIWFIIFSLILASIFAGLTASLVSSVLSEGEPFQKILDVGKKPIAVYRGKSATTFAMNAGLNVVSFPKTIDEAINALDSTKVDGVFLLLASAHAYLNTHSRQDLYISPIQFYSLPMGFMVSDTKKELLRKINKSLLKLSEDGTKLDICNRYSNSISITNCH